MEWKILQVDQLISTFGFGNVHVGIILQEREGERERWFPSKENLICNKLRTPSLIILRIGCNWGHVLGVT